MNWYRHYPGFAIGLTVCGLVAAGQIALGVERWFASRSEASRLQQRRAELEGVGQLQPAPTREVAVAIEADLARAQAALAAMRTELSGQPAAVEKLRAAKVPTARTDAFFDLATYVERVREAAAKAGVQLRPEAARAGFAQYANEGPETDRIEPVFRQRQLAEYLVTILLEARPEAILAIRRERPLTRAERGAAAEAIANGQPPPAPEGGDGPDYFAQDPRGSARVPGFVETTGFRLTFQGETAALRLFLNRLTAFELPFLVREVEVEPVGVEEAADAPAAVGSAVTAAPLNALPSASETGAAKAPVQAPLVPRSTSRFTVTVEHLELLTPSPAEGSVEATNP
ncbi:MAG: hypothetical protein ACO3G4_11755 [Opitutaceae bacterium]